MARTRRRKRTSTQRIAGLVAIGLPAPMQRVADTRLGSLMMLIFIPAMIISGVLTVDWKNGTPSLNLNRNKAQELKQKATKELNQWSQDGTLQNWQANVEKAWQQAQQNVPSSQNNNAQGSWMPQHPAWQAKDERSFPTTLPTTGPGGLVSHSQFPTQQQQPQGLWNQWNTQAQPTTPQPQTQYGSQNFNAPTTAQPAYPQPNYGQQNTWPSGYTNQPQTYNQPNTTLPSQGGYNYPSAAQTNPYQPSYGSAQSNTGTTSGGWLR